MVSSHKADSKPVKQEVNSTVILPSLVFPGTDPHSQLPLTVPTPCDFEQNALKVASVNDPYYLCDVLVQRFLDGVHPLAGIDDHQLILQLYAGIKILLLSSRLENVFPQLISGANKLESGNTKGGSITVPLTSCLTGLESAE